MEHERLGKRVVGPSVSRIGNERRNVLVQGFGKEDGPPWAEIRCAGTVGILGESVPYLRADQHKAIRRFSLTSYSNLSYPSGTYASLEEFKIELALPIRLESESNRGSVWSKKAAFVSIKKHKVQKSTTHLLLLGTLNALFATPKAIVEEWRSTRGKWLCIATIVRQGKRKLDSDNLARSAKRVRDSVAQTLGVDDGDECESDSRWEWKYGQYVAKEYGTIVVLEWRKL